MIALTRPWIALLLALALTALAAPLPVVAQQYRSEVKELDEVPATAPPVDLQKQLQTTKDPYARALLLRELAAKSAQAKDYAQASKYLEQALATGALSGPAAEQMKRDLSQLVMSSGDVKKMLPQLEAQVKAGRATPEMQVALGAAYLEQKRYAEAVPLLQQGLAATPKPPLAWQRALAAALFAAGREREALPLLESLLRQDPSQRDDWLRVAALYLKVGQKERAQAALEIAHRLGFLDSGEDKLRLVSLTAQIGVPYEAASLLQQWMQNGALPKDGRNWRSLAGLWTAARESGPAIAALEEAIRITPDAALYRQLAQLRMDREEYAQAARALEQALQRGRDGRSLLALGLARYQQADVEGAIAAFREATQYEVSRNSAQEWVRYLESAEARSQALAAAAQRRQRSDEPLRLSSVAEDDPIRLSAPTQEAVSTAPLALAGEALTPVGAERAGNRDQSIPPWTGGLLPPQWPSNYKPGGRLQDPFPREKPLFTITAANMGQYRNRLTPFHQHLLQRYPDYVMPVYRSHRTVAYPDAIYAATKANRGKAKLSSPDALENAFLGFPFPVPSSGVEVMWNHRTRYRGDSVDMQSTQAVVEASGRVQLTKQIERVSFRYGNLKDPADLSRDNILMYYLTWFGDSRNDVDILALVHETANAERGLRSMWVLPPKMRKMFRIPPIGYDQPFPASEGLMFVDMLDMYNGSFDRYTWKLVGKRELYVPYNGYRLIDGSVKYAELLKPGHIDQRHTRYELHRVWVIEATERPGKRHAFGKRVFYVDEDSWNVILVENYDREGGPWRFQEGHLLAFYDAKYANAAPVVTYDFKSGRYFVNRLLAEEPPIRYNLPMPDREFLPAAVKARYGG